MATIQMKLALCTLLFLLSKNMMAQYSKALDEYKHGRLDEAAKSVKLAEEDPATIKSYDFWKLRGDIYFDIYMSKNPLFKNIEKNPEDIFADSYVRAYDQNTSYETSIKIKDKLENIRTLLRNKAVTDFKSKRFEAAYQSFSKIILIDSRISPQKLDTITYYNAAVSAEKSKLYAKSIELYERLGNFKNNDPRVYLSKATCYEMMSDTSNAAKFYKEGISKFPKENDLLVLGIINMYLKTDKPEKAINYIEKAVMKDPNNYQFYFALGTLYDKTFQTEKAKKSYLKAINIKPDYFEAFHNLGAIFYNNAADSKNRASKFKDSDQEKYLEELDKCKSLFAQSLPYIEKAYSINSSNYNVVQMLSIIYLELDKPDEAAQMNKILKILKP